VTRTEPEGRVRVAAAGRITLAPVFVVGGWQAATAPSALSEAAAGAGLQVPRSLVQANATVMIVGGLLLGIGWRPRPTALVLAACLAPSTLVAHNFWKHTGQDRRQQTLLFFKDLAMVGGLLLIASDRPPARQRCGAPGFGT